MQCKSPHRNRSHYILKQNLKLQGSDATNSRWDSGGAFLDKFGQQVGSFVGYYIG